MAVTCMCIEKFRDKHGKIKGYRLQDSQGKCLDVTPDNLKMAIVKKQFNVGNLQLTSNGRLLDKKYSHSKNVYIDKINNILNELNVKDKISNDKISLQEVYTYIIEAMLKTASEHKGIGEKDIKIDKCMNHIRIYIKYGEKSIPLCVYIKDTNIENQININFDFLRLKQHNDKLDFVVEDTDSITFENKIDNRERLINRIYRKVDMCIATNMLIAAMFC